LVSYAATGERQLQPNFGNGGLTDVALFKYEILSLGDYFATVVKETYLYQNEVFLTTFSPHL
jgi:hypothetical protein